jgi:hypothetical protein
MLELKVSQLANDDEFTADDGETWWKVILNAVDGPYRRRLSIQCVGSQRADTPVGHVGYSVRYNDDLVIVR